MSNESEQPMAENSSSSDNSIQEENPHGGGGISYSSSGNVKSHLHSPDNKTKNVPTGLPVFEELVPIGDGEEYEDPMACSGTSKSIGY